MQISLGPHLRGRGCVLIGRLLEGLGLAFGMWVLALGWGCCSAVVDDGWRGGCASRHPFQRGTESLGRFGFGRDHRPELLRSAVTTTSGEVLSVPRRSRFGLSTSLLADGTEDRWGGLADGGSVIRAKAPRSFSGPKEVRGARCRRRCRTGWRPRRCSHPGRASKAPSGLGRRWGRRKGYDVVEG